MSALVSSSNVTTIIIYPLSTTTISTEFDHLMPSCSLVVDNVIWLPIILAIVSASASSISSDSQATTGRLTKCVLRIFGLSLDGCDSFGVSLSGRTRSRSNEGANMLRVVPTACAGGFTVISDWQAAKQTKTHSTGQRTAED